MNEISELMKNVHFQSCYPKGCGTQSYRNGQLKRHKGIADRNVMTSTFPRSPKLLAISRTMSDQTCRSHPNKILLSDVQETWEEQSIENSIEEVDGIPFAPPSKECHLSETEKCETRRCSRESSGSVVSGLSSTSSSCVVIVTEMCEQDELQPLPTQPVDSTHTEDDVFLSQWCDNKVRTVLQVYLCVNHHQSCFECFGNTVSYT